MFEPRDNFFKITSKLYSYLFFIDFDLLNIVKIHNKNVQIINISLLFRFLD